MENKWQDPKTGRFIAGNQASKLSERNVARRIYEALRDCISAEEIQQKFRELLNSPSESVKKETLFGWLAYVIGKPAERLSITTGDGQTLFNVSLLSPEDQSALEAITLRAMTGTVKLIDVDSEIVKTPTVDPK